MRRKLGAENNRQMMENTPLQMGPYSSGTNCLQTLQEFSPVNQVILGKRRGSDTSGEVKEW
jgi:hypothetical protein